MTESELRDVVVDQALRSVGAARYSVKHLDLLNAYNARTPLPRGYAVKPADDYCMTAVSAWFILAGLADLFPVECGVGESQKIAEQMGVWQENDAYVPKPGDAVLFDWKDSGIGDNTGWPGHVMLVRSCGGGQIYCVNPNDTNKGISLYTLPVNSVNIRGFIVPKFAEKATDSDDKTQEPKEYARWVGEVYNTAYLNVRTSAGVKADNIYKPYPGLHPTNLIDVIGEEKAQDGVIWYKIVIGGIHTAFASSKYIKRAGAEPWKPEVGKPCHVTTAYMYASSYSNGKKVALNDGKVVSFQGTVVQYIEGRAHPFWVKSGSGAYDGWVNADTLSK